MTKEFEELKSAYINLFRQYEKLLKFVAPLKTIETMTVYEPKRINPFLGQEYGGKGYFIGDSIVGKELYDSVKQISKIKIDYSYIPARIIDVKLKEEKKMNKFITNNPELKPVRATQHSAGYDFIAPKDYVVPAHGTCLIESEVAVQLEEDKVLMLYVRSSYGFKYGVTLSNGTGIIDADFFPNKMKCKLKNDSDNDLIIHKGDHYMQGIIMSYFKVDDDDTVNVRNGGIGSTGK